jgi:hypothetical protein
MTMDILCFYVLNTVFPGKFVSDKLLTNLNIARAVEIMDGPQ